MNLVMDETTEFKKDGTKTSIGMVVVRGNSVVMLEAKDRVWWLGMVWGAKGDFELPPL